MSKVNEYLNDPDCKCSLCGIIFPHLVIKNEFIGEKYCSEQCRIEFHHKLRQWALEKFQSGSITKEELQRVHSKTILTEGLN